MNVTVDVIVVGAGAAGPVIAARLSEDPGVQVALIEAGGENINDVGRMQGAFFYTWGTPMNWAYKTVPQPRLGGRQIDEPRGRLQASPRATLCRYGLSQNKPFCDGSHTAGFVATGEPAKTDFADLPQRNGPVDVRPIPHGPLRLVGNLEVVSGTSRTCNQLGEAFLCRCGQSRNKPYCGGSHKAAGFSAE